MLKELRKVEKQLQECFEYLTAAQPLSASNLRRGKHPLPKEQMIKNDSRVVDQPQNQRTALYQRFMTQLYEACCAPQYEATSRRMAATSSGVLPHDASDTEKADFMHQLIYLGAGHTNMSFVIDRLYDKCPMVGKHEQNIW